MIIYKITNRTNNKIYIGQTVRGLEERINEHLRHRTTYFDKMFKKSNVKDFIIEIIDSANSIEELNKKEIYWINKHNSLYPNGYNMCRGGENTTGYKHKEESKKKMSISKSKMYLGANNPFFNKTHSKEQKEKWSRDRKGMAHLTEEQRNKLKETHVTKKVKNIDTGEIFVSIKDAANQYNLKATHISRVCKGKRKTTGGFRWSYI
jgi:group I intron endonuclease